MSNTWKIIIGGLIAIAIALGLIQRTRDPYTNYKPTGLQYQGTAQDMSLADFYNQGQSMAAGGQATSTTVSFLAVGDIMLSRNVAATIQKSGDIDLPFRQMADVLKSTNFNFANLESPIAPGQPVIGGNSLTFGAPAQYAQGLRDYNFQIINSANNHAFDQGLAGIDKTKAALDALGIVHEGTGDNLDEAWQPAAVSVDGIKICFIGAAYGTNTGGAVAAKYVAEISETDKLKTAIGQAKSECNYTVVTMHAGIEYTRTPNLAQTTFAHTAVDDGADIVIGAHPHWVQPIEKYNGKYIFYSLGNFVFDQDFSTDTMQGLALKIQISDNQTASVQNPTTPNAAGLNDLQGPRQPATLASIQLIPVIIQNSQVRPATDEETKNILGKINESQTELYP